MDFSLSPVAAEYGERLADFMAGHVLPAEAVYHEQRAELAARGQLHTLPPVVDQLKTESPFRSSALDNLVYSAEFEQFPSFDDADFVTKIGELGKNV